MQKDLDQIFKALGDPSRRYILQMLVLATGALNITAIADEFSSTRQAVTKHIQVLESAGLVKGTRSGREIVYQAHPEKLELVQDWLSTYQEFWNDKLGALGEHLDKKKNNI